MNSRERLEEKLFQDYIMNVNECRSYMLNLSQRDAKGHK